MDIRYHELRPNTSHKSFYGKALVAEVMAEKTAYLRSYQTRVAAIDWENKRFKRTWDGYSATTMRHVNAFLEAYGLAGGGKKWWWSTPLGEWINC